jgi:hypothetical protein
MPVGVAQCRPLRSSAGAAHAPSDMQTDEKANRYTAHHTTGIPLAQSHMVEAKLPYSVKLRALADIPNIDEKGTLQRTST